MKEKLTREVLEVMKKCSFSCALCDASGVCDKYDWQDTIQTLAAALLEEMDKPKVWDGAPEKATRAEVYFSHDLYGDSGGVDMTYTRELPKTRARIMAEEIASAKISNEKDLVDIIEQTINTHVKELNGEA